MEVNLALASGKEKTLENLGKRIVRLRLERRWTQADLAQCLGVVREPVQGAEP